MPAGCSWCSLDALSVEMTCMCNACKNRGCCAWILRWQQIIAGGKSDFAVDKCKEHVIIFIRVVEFVCTRDAHTNILWILTLLCLLVVELGTPGSEKNNRLFVVKILFNMYI